MKWPLRWLAKATPPAAADPDTDDEDEQEDDVDQAERKKRHRHLVLAYRLLLKETNHRVAQLAFLLAEGKIDTREWAAAFRKELAEAHGEAWSIGRKLAGHAGPMNGDDVAAGAQSWERQEEFYRKFLSDVEDGRYTNRRKVPASEEDGESSSTADELNEKAVAARSRQYAASLKGTVNEAFRVALVDESTSWVLSSTEHCKPSKNYPYNCPDLAAESPKPASEWQTAPGLGGCPCGGNCACYMETEDGGHSTEGI